MSETTTDLDDRIAARIRALRLAGGLTLDALAQRADVSRAMLSRVERAESSPTAQLLNRICGGLGITLSALFAGAERVSSPLSRRADQPVWRDPQSGYQRRAVSPPGTLSPVDIVEIEFPPGASVAFDNHAVVATDQHVWVLDGTLALECEGETYLLATGDCLVMRFGQPVRFHNPTSRMTRYAVIVARGAVAP